MQKLYRNISDGLKGNMLCTMSPIIDMLQFTRHLCPANKKYGLICSLLWLSLAVMAQDIGKSTDMDADTPNRHMPISPHWYVGVQGGVPFGISTFSSFGADKTRAGGTAGVYAGYRFTPVLSAEISMKWGKTALSAQDCCIEKSYWLGADEVHYNAMPSGKDGWNYADLKSGVFVQNYGVQLNVNVLGLFERTRHSRWTLELSPTLSAAGTRASVATISTDAEVMKGNTDWHLGAGGNLQAGYRLNRLLSVGIYSGLTYLTGNRMDGMPEYRHRNNFIWESGIRLGFTLGGRERDRHSRRQEPAVVATQSAAATDITAQPVVPAVVPTEQPVIPTDNPPAETDSLPLETKAEAALAFPTVYFAFNSTKIAPDELPKLQAMREMLATHPQAQITVTGWCDRRGTASVNLRISRQRAEAVRTWLTRHGIEAGRIRTQGKGSDPDEPEAGKARRVEVTNEKEK